MTSHEEDKTKHEGEAMKHFVVVTVIATILVFSGIAMGECPVRCSNSLCCPAGTQCCNYGGKTYCCTGKQCCSGGGCCSTGTHCCTNGKGGTECCSNESPKICNIEDRDRIEAKCLVDRQCGERNLCKLECLNKANVESGCRKD